jgi:ferric-dicitrate binding protein FerR (iron transport regulator)
MDLRRTELRDELAAIIAAGRELTPEHDQVLAEAFIDRVASRIAAPPSRANYALTFFSRPRRLVGAIVLSLACIGGASAAALHHEAGPGSDEAPVSVNVPAKPVPPKMPVIPAPKAPPNAPQAPAPKSAP